MIAYRQRILHLHVLCIIIYRERNGALQVVNHVSNCNQIRNLIIIVSLSQCQVCVTLGTTGACAFDNLAEIAEVCKYR